MMRRYNEDSFVGRQGVWIVVWAALGVGLRETRGEVTAVRLPEEYVDFAQDPETGTIAALSGKKNELVFFEREQLVAGGGRANPTARVKVGGAPSAVVFKRYRRLRVFAVTCLHDSHIYLVSAKGRSQRERARFQVLFKIDLGEFGAIHIATSRNDEDPFLYCSSQAQSVCLVASLRDMRTWRQVLVPERSITALSASGEVAYRPSTGYESLIRTNSLHDRAPEFHPLLLNQDNHSARDYVPDPFDRLTAIGRLILDRNLERVEASLDFEPVCFFETRPVIVGMERSSPAAPQPVELPNITLRAVSYNTLKEIGEPVVIPRAPGEEANPPPPARGPERLETRERVFADDVRGEIVHADRDWLRIVHLADFKLPQEPLLVARLKGPRELRVDQPVELELVPLGKKSTVTFTGTPEGAKVRGNTLTWSPTGKQVGPATIAVTVSEGEYELVWHFELRVKLPSVTLPFAPDDFTLDPSGKRAAIWELVESHNPRHGHRSRLRLAILDLESGKLVSQRQHPGPIHGCLLDDEYLVLLPAQQQTE